MSDPSPMGAYGSSPSVGRRTTFCSLLRTSDQSIPNGDSTIISFSPATVVDTDEMYSAGSPTRITCVVAGLYLVTGGLYWEVNTTGYRSCRILVNGALAAGQAAQAPPVVPALHSVSVAIPLVVGDYVEMQVRQNSGGALDAVAVASAPRLSATWLAWPAA